MTIKYVSLKDEIEIRQQVTRFDKGLRFLILFQKFFKMLSYFTQHGASQGRALNFVFGSN